MSSREILLNIRKLPFEQRLLVIEKAIKTLHESTDYHLEKAAIALLSDYQNNKDLTAFTSLDFENFYETR
jgi:hypothetical protein